MPKITRYADENIIEYEGKKMYEIRDTIDISFRNTDEMYTVNEGDTLRDIAYRVWGEARYYWIIAEFNKIIDPFKNLVVGTELRYPSLLRIREEIL